MSSPAPETDSGFYGFTTRRPVAILMVVVAVGLFGALCYGRLPVSLMPDVSYPVLTVRSEYPGAAPEEVETLVTAPAEEALEVVTDLIQLRSVSRAETSDITLEFSWDTDIDRRSLEVREKLDQVIFPDEAERPLILRYDPSLDPILRIGITSDSTESGEEATDLYRLRELAEEVVRRELEGLEGVAAVGVRGGLEEVIRVELREDALARLGIAPTDVATRLREENVNLAGGSLEEGETTYLVRALNEFQSLTEVKDLVVAQRGDGWVRLRDLADVRRDHEERKVLTRVNGAPSVEIEVFKEGDQNEVDVARLVKRRIFGTPRPDEETGSESPDAAGTIQNLLPEDVHLHLISDRSVFIEQAVREVESTALYGGLLALLILYLFLRNLKRSAIVGVAIPISVIVTFAPMYLFDVSLNVMSLGGIALGIGMLVDNAIVVLESIHRCQEEGDDRIAAAIRGTGEVGSAVIASTLTTVCVFFPLVFVEGVAGQIFSDQALTVVFSLLASLAVALFFVPMLASRRLPHEATGEDDDGEKGASQIRNLFRFPELPEWNRIRSIGRQKWRILLLPIDGALLLLRATLWAVSRLCLGVLLLVLLLVVTLFRGLGFLFRWTVALPAGAFQKGFDGLRAGYRRLLRGALAIPGVILLASLALLVWTGQQLDDLGSELIPTVHEGTFDLALEAPIGTPLETTDRAARRLESVIGGLPPERIQSWSTVVGGEEDQTSATGDRGSHTATITVSVRSEDDIRAAEQRVLDDLQQVMQRLPDMEVNVRHPSLFSFKTPVEIWVKGTHLGRIARATRRLADRLEALPFLRDVRTTLQRGNPEIQIRYNRDKMIQLGLDLMAVATLVRNKIQGTVPTRYRKRERKIDMRVQLREEDRRTLEDLSGLIVNPGQPNPIPLKAVADLTIGEGPAEIRRLGRQRAQLISANLRATDLGRAGTAIARILGEQALPRGVTADSSGQNQEMKVSLRSLLMALGLAVFLVYVVMASLFESLIQPFIILFAIPFAIVGVVWSLLWLNIPLSIVVGIGTIVLVGMVVNNAIVLVDYANQLRDRGMSRTEALVEAGAIRLRPILMTTATTVVGLLPMSLGFGEGAELRTPLAVTVIAGLLSSTVLTLVLLPCLYQLADFRSDESEKETDR